MASKFVPSRAKVLGYALRPPSAVGLPGFTLPAWQTFAPRQFSTTTKRTSKLGRTPISIPPGVELSMSDLKTANSKTSYKPTVKRTIEVKGPLGTLELDVPEFVSLQQDLENSTALLSVEDANIKQQNEMWGTSWSYLTNYIMGVSEGHTAILRLVGVGYRASVERRGAKEQYPGQKFLCLKLGFTHPVEEGIPKGVTVTTPSPTRILLEGTDREVIMSFAGRVRMWRPPEPYKGKGVFINDQTIKLKQKKIK
ncbi:54S ribosomal protein L6 mitochondrial [Conoideocrella luteorostrata]|uniref:54S ribosomal protein L6 mitochondrial n=1 Tax=Conoideocrella luteorostrata TaxID=1105319 RepID=A0AAJ0CRL1_9HYPO|nr:54S ribosomal protein L6 mitochondrial [Conoideocrella luteorostrata]